MEVGKLYRALSDSSSGSTVQERGDVAGVGGAHSADGEHQDDHELSEVELGSLQHRIARVDVALYSRGSEASPCCTSRLRCRTAPKLSGLPKTAEIRTTAASATLLPVGWVRHP